MGGAAPLWQKDVTHARGSGPAPRWERACLLDATDKVRSEMGEDIHLKPRRWKQIEFVMLLAESRFLGWNGNGDRCDQIRQHQSAGLATCIASRRHTMLGRARQWLGQTTHSDISANEPTE